VAETTVSSMHDARDAEDQRLLEAGEYSALLESYYGAIVRRCQARVHDERALDVAGEVVVRLLSELKRGRRYRVPFRVVVHQVTSWKIKEHFAGDGVSEVELEDWMREASSEGTGPIEGLMAGQGFEALLEGLSELEKQVVSWHYGDDLDFAEIAGRLDKAPNAVHQIHFRALAKLRKAWT
jgi:RNA polymerase sigma factor (sigma-70 family)